MTSRLAKIVFTALALLIGIGGTAYMMGHKVTPERAEVAERVVPVAVMAVTYTSHQVTVRAQGTVTAAQQIQVRPEVTGRIVELSSSLVPGGLLAAGEVIARIDERDYLARLSAQQEAVAGANLRLREERARQAVARQEWQLMEGTIPADQESHDLALRLPQIEQAEAALAAARGALDKAILDLERCTVRAPFHSVVLREQVDLGQVVNPQSEIATLVGTGRYWVQVSLPLEDLAWIELPTAGGGDGSSVRVINQAGEVVIERQGRVERLLGDVDPAGRLARLLVVIEDPLNLHGSHGQVKLPLLLGSYVSVEIAGREVTDVVMLPCLALREVIAEDGTAHDGVWLVDHDSRLQSRQVEVLWRSQDTVLVRNSLAEGEQIVTSGIATPIEGMRLEARPAAAASRG